MVKKWLTPSTGAPFVSTVTLVEGRGTSARIDFGGVLEMTGPMMWNDRLVRTARRPRLAGGRKHAFIFGNCDG